MNLIKHYPNTNVNITRINWCTNLRLNVNKSKSQVVHFRGTRIIQSNFKFKYGNSVLDTVSYCKYLGVILDEHLTLNKCSKSLSGSGERALGAIWSKFKLMKNVKVNSYSKLYETGIIPILDCVSGIWGYSGNNH